MMGRCRADGGMWWSCDVNSGITICVWKFSSRLAATRDDKIDSTAADSYCTGVRHRRWWPEIAPEAEA